MNFYFYALSNGSYSSPSDLGPPSGNDLESKLQQVAKGLKGRVRLLFHKHHSQNSGIIITIIIIIIIIIITTCTPPN